MNSYHVLELVGEGSFGRVHKGRKKFSGQVVALKFMPKVGRSEKELRNLKREIEIMRDLQHPNIVQLFDSFETDTEVVVVTEYAEGQLFQILEDDGGLSENHVRDIACQLVSALYYLHSHRILHRDMKPQNILLGKNGEVKLCDFGFARAMSVSTLVLTSIKGTPLYMSPELVEERPYDHTADLWALGCILYELHTGAPPFYTNSIFHLVQMIVRDPVKWPQDMSESCTSFLQGLLTKDPQKRLSWPHLLHHPFVVDGVQVLSDLTTLSPLTEAQSPEVMALKLQQVASKTPRAVGESRLLQKARIKSTKKTTKGLKCVDSERSQSKAASSSPTKLPPLEDTLKRPGRKSNSVCNQISKHRSQISRDYAQEFPSAEAGPLFLRTCFEERRAALPEQKTDAEEYWENLQQEVHQNGLKVVKNNDCIPKLKSTFLIFKTQVITGGVQEPLEILQTLKFLTYIMDSFDQEESYDLFLQSGLPGLLFDLIRALVETSNVTMPPWYVPTLEKMLELLLIFWSSHCEWAEQDYSELEEHAKTFVAILKQPKLKTLAPLAAALLSVLIQHDVPVYCDLDTLVTLLRDLWKIDKTCAPLPAGRGVFDGILALLLHVLSEHEGGPGASCLDSDLFLDLWKRIGASLGRTPPSTDQYSASGLFSFLSLALLVFTQDPNSCVPLFSEASYKCIYTLSLLLKPDSLGLFVEDSPRRLETDGTPDSLSTLSCHLLCFPFALDVPALSMHRILDLYVSCNVVAGLLQVIHMQTPPLLELPLSLLSRLLLCDPERSLSCLGDSACDFFTPCRESHLTVSTSRPHKSAMSLLSELLQSDVLWDAAGALLTVLSQVARCSPLFHLEVSVLQQALTHSHELIRAAACRLMANMQPFKLSTLSSACGTFKLLVHCLSDHSVPVRRLACRALGSWLGGLAEAGYKCSKTTSDQEGDMSVVIGGVEEWTEAVRSSVTALTSALTDPDTVTRRHSCAALGNLVKLQGAVEWLIEEDVSSSLLRAACMDCHHTVRHAAITALCVFCQQEPVRQVLMSSAAKRKLLQASRTFPQNDYEQLVGQL